MKYIFTKKSFKKALKKNPKRLQKTRSKKRQCTRQKTGGVWRWEGLAPLYGGDLWECMLMYVLYYVLEVVSCGLACCVGCRSKALLYFFFYFSSCTDVSFSCSLPVAAIIFVHCAHREMRSSLSDLTGRTAFVPASHILLLQKSITAS